MPIREIKTPKEELELKSQIEYLNMLEKALKIKAKCFIKGEGFFKKFGDFEYSRAVYYYDFSKSSYQNSSLKKSNLVINKYHLTHLRSKYLKDFEELLNIKEKIATNHKGVFVPSEEYTSLMKELEKQINNKNLNHKTKFSSIKIEEPKLKLNENCKISNLQPQAIENDNKLNDIIWDHLKNNGYGISSNRMFFYPEICNNKLVDTEQANNSHSTNKTPIR